jgi:hypothetical protein
MDVSRPTPSAPAPPRAVAETADRKRFVAPVVERHDRLPAITGGSVICFPGTQC